MTKSPTKVSARQCSIASERCSSIASPLSPNSDIDHDETEVTFCPAPPDDSTLTQRRRSSSRLPASNQPADRRAGGLQQTIREFLAE